MLARRFLRGRMFVDLRFSCVPPRWSHQSSAADEMQGRIVDYFTQQPEKEAKNEPLAKSLFIGKLDVEFMPYPEIPYPRYNDFMEWMSPIENYISSCVERGDVSKEEILSELRDLGLFRAIVSEKYSGLGFLEQETTSLVETVSAIPWLGIYVVQNYILPTRLILRYGSDQVKEKYLRKIAKGEIVPTICTSESIGGTNVFHMKSKATIRSDDKWLLNGEKSLVYNAADANVFIVIAHSTHSNMYAEKNNLCMLVVERDSSGISLGSTEETVGHRKTSVGSVSFKDTVVPAENVIHETNVTVNILKDILSPGKQDMAPVAIGILKHFIRLLTSNVLQRKHMDGNMYEQVCVKDTIGKLTASLYGMQSALYWTAGIADTFEDQDIELERAITETYCANECVKSIQAGLHTIGAPSYLRKYPYMEALEDAMLYSTFCNYDTDAKMYIALLGLQHAGKHIHDAVFKSRNPFMFPIEMVRTFLSRTKKLDLYIPDNLHPSFRVSGEEVEKCIYLLKTSVAELFGNHGLGIADHHLDLCRLSDMAIQIYVALACLSRASRSYCTGVKNSDSERYLAAAIVHTTHVNVTQLAAALSDGMHVNGDFLYKKLADDVYKAKGYFVESPLAQVV